MNRRTTTRFVLALVALVLPWTMLSAQGLMLSGHVFSAVDRQAVQAEVVLYSANSNSNGAFVPVNKAMTDAQGAYSFTVSPNTKVYVEAYPIDMKYRATFYPDAADLQSATALSMTQAQSGIDILVPQATTQKYSISGMVTTVQGQAMDAIVVISGANTTTQSYTVVTDANKTGWFSVDLSGPGAYVVQVLPSTTTFSAGYYRANDVVTSSISQATVVAINSQGQSSATIQVLVGSSSGSPVYTVKGIVVDMNKQPIAGAQISVIDASGTVVNNPGPCISAKDGTYSCTVAGDGAYQILCQAAGYLDNTQRLSLGQGTSTQYVNFIMTAATPPQYNNALWGTVLSADGTPVLAKVEAMLAGTNSNGANGAVSAVTTSDPRTGQFEFDNLKPGVYMLFAISGDAAYASGYYVVNATADPDMKNATPITVQENAKNDKPYVISLGKANVIQRYTLWAFVVDENNLPLADVVFHATDAKGNDVLLNQVTTTDLSGMVQLQFPGEGTYTVSATKDGYQDGVGSISFSSGFYAQKTFVQLKKKDQTGGNESAQIVAGVSDIQNSVSSVAPQPAQSELRISLANAQTADQLIVYSLNGQVVMQQHVAPASTLNLDIHALQNACYELRLMSNGVLVGHSLFVKD